VGSRLSRCSGARIDIACLELRERLAVNQCGGEGGGTTYGVFGEAVLLCFRQLLRCVALRCVWLRSAASEGGALLRTYYRSSPGCCMWAEASCVASRDCRASLKPMPGWRPVPQSWLRLRSVSPEASERYRLPDVDSEWGVESLESGCRVVNGRALGMRGLRYVSCLTLCAT